MGKVTRDCSVLTRIATASNRIGAALFNRSDARARDLGWEVVRSRSGLHRSYRDPRFDRLAACPSCSGTGCDRCGGTGRIVRSAPGDAENVGANGRISR